VHFLKRPLYLSAMFYPINVIYTFHNIQSSQHTLVNHQTDWLQSPEFSELSATKNNKNISILVDFGVFTVLYAGKGKETEDLRILQTAVN